MGNHFDEQIVRSHLYDLGGQFVRLVETVGVLIPGIRQRVFEREAHLLRLRVELHDFDLHDVTDLYDLRRVLDTRVGKFAVVNQPVNAAEVDESTKIG